MAKEKQDHVDEAACLYVADDLYDDLHSDNIICLGLAAAGMVS